MKTILMLTLLFVSANAYSGSCDTIENGKKIMCNNYDTSKKSELDDLKKLCSMGDMDSPYMKIKGVYNDGSCNTAGAIAKCKVKGVDTTFYYAGELETLKAGCGMMKGTEFVTF